MKIFMRILWIVGLLAWSCCFALGFNYGNADSLLISVILLVAVFCIMGIDIFLLNRWSNPESGVNQKNAKIKEISCLAVYAIMVVLTITGVAHFITVQTTIKSEVRPLAKDRINEIRQMFGDEETAGSFESYVDQLAVTYRNTIKGDYADESTLDAAVNKFEDSLLGEEYDDLAEKADEFISGCKGSINMWTPWDVTENLAKLDENAPVWAAKLKALSESNEYAREMNEFYNPPVQGTTDFAAQVRDSAISNFGLLPIIIIIILQIMILFEYLREKDWAQSGPKKHKSKDGGPAVYNPNKPRKFFKENEGEAGFDDKNDNNDSPFGN